MSSVVLQCPICTKPFGVLPEQAGQIVKCPSCMNAVTIPNDLGIESPAKPPESNVGAQSNPTFSCPSCAGKFGVTREMYGQQVGCPHCQRTVLIQDPNSTRPVPGTNQPSPNPSSSESQDLFAPGYQPKKSSTESAPIIVGRKRSRKKQIVVPDNVGDAKSQKVEPSESVSPSEAPTKAPTGANANLPPAVETKKTTKDSLLPPTSSTGATDANGREEERRDTATDESTAVEPASDEKPDNGLGIKPPAPKSRELAIAAMLPPRFEVTDPENLRIQSASDHKVFLPDGAGGVRQVDDRVLRVQHEGQDVHLVAMSADERRKRRNFRNAMMILVGILILIIAFIILANM